MTEKPPKELNKLSMILHATVEKAMNNGFSFEGRESLTAGSRGETTGEFIEHNGHYQFIFDHHFAKALWGEEERKSPLEVPKEQRGGTFNGGMGFGAFETITKKGWKYHLQQMVIADDPIVYLGENT